MKYKTFKTFLIEEEKDYYYALNLLEQYNQNIITESQFSDILKNVSSKIKSKIKFIKEITNIIGKKISDIIDFLKNKKVFEIFKLLKFSVKYIVDVYKKGVKALHQIEGIITNKIAELGGVKYIRKNISNLDDFFKEHPVLKKIGGIVVAGILLNIWLNMAYSPDFEWSLKWTDIISALAGNYNLNDLFLSPDGINMLIYLMIGSIFGLSFPWPGSLTHQIIVGFIWGVYDYIKPKNVVIQKPK